MTVSWTSPSIGCRSELDPFINKKLFDDRLVLVARGGHPSINAGVTIEDLLKAEFVGPHRRREIDHLPQALQRILQAGNARDGARERASRNTHRRRKH